MTSHHRVALDRLARTAVGTPINGNTIAASGTMKEAERSNCVSPTAATKTTRPNPTAHTAAKMRGRAAYLARALQSGVQKRVVGGVQR